MHASRENICMVQVEYREQTSQKTFVKKRFVAISSGYPPHHVTYFWVQLPAMCDSTDATDSTNNSHNETGIERG